MIGFLILSCESDSKHHCQLNVPVKRLLESVGEKTQASFSTERDLASRPRKAQELKCKWAEDYEWKEHLLHIPNLNCCCCFSSQTFTEAHINDAAVSQACNFVLSFTFFVDKTWSRNIYHLQETIDWLQLNSQLSVIPKWELNLKPCLCLG